MNVECYKRNTQKTTEKSNIKKGRKQYVTSSLKVCLPFSHIQRFPVQRDTNHPNISI